MRENKFRAWDGKKMEYDVQDKTVTISKKLSVFWGCPEHITLFRLCRLNKEKLKVLQYTGLKDKNGKEIYEGDVVKWERNGILQVLYGLRYKSEYGYHSASFGVSRKRPKGLIGTKTTWDDLHSIIVQEMKVIGNIYENPELLKEIKWER